MKIKKFDVKYMQDGGQAPVPAEAQGAPQGAPAQGGAEEQLAQVAQQILESLMQALGDPNAVAAVLQMAMEMLQGAAQEVGAQPQEVGFQRKGGKICKKACGGKAKTMRK